MTIVICLLLCVLMVFLFFFFKQKTAYEMRISDWSSDVCSSDLLGGHGAGTKERRRPHRYALASPERRGRWHAAREDGLQPAECERKIGRASCRERVCQYV